MHAKQEAMANDEFAREVGGDGGTGGVSRERGWRGGKKSTTGKAEVGRGGGERLRIPLPNAHTGHATHIPTGTAGSGGYCLG
jgi:hypothetical protein